MPVGRERRRKGPVNRLRRFLYGLLLVAAAPGAMAADELAALGHHRPVPKSSVNSAPERALVASLQGLVLIHGESVGVTEAAARRGWAYPRVALDTVTARVPETLDAPLFRVAVSDGREVRDGVGFDLAVPELGNFHLNLYTRRSARSEGRRWAAIAGGSAADDAPGPGPGPTWSLGGTLELVRTLDGAKHVAIVPEVLLDLDGKPESYLPFQVSLKMAHWRSLAEKQSLDERVPQLSFKWRL